MAQQFSFDLSRRPALRREDFLISTANETALALLDKPELWPNQRLVLTGPPASGKTHLVHAWAAQTGARLVDPKTLTAVDLLEVTTAPIALDGADALAADAGSEEALFHLCNLMMETRQPLLMTASAAPTAWPIKLPDLASRLQAAGHAALEPPDDALLAAVLMKQLAERQIDADPDLISYATARMDRSFAAARALAEAVNRAAYSERRKVTKRLVGAVLDEMCDRRPE